MNSCHWCAVSWCAEPRFKHYRLTGKARTKPLVKLAFSFSPSGLYIYVFQPLGMTGIIKPYYTVTVPLHHLWSSQLEYTGVPVDLCLLFFLKEQLD